MGKLLFLTEDVKAELLVLSDEAVADNPYKYEIYSLISLLKVYVCFLRLEMKAVIF